MTKMEAGLSKMAILALHEYRQKADPNRLTLRLMQIEESIVSGKPIAPTRLSPEGAILPCWGDPATADEPEDSL